MAKPAVLDVEATEFVPVATDEVDVYPEDVTDPEPI